MTRTQHNKRSRLRAAFFFIHEWVSPNWKAVAGRVPLRACRLDRGVPPAWWSAGRASGRFANSLRVAHQPARVTHSVDAQLRTIPSFATERAKIRRTMRQSPENLDIRRLPGLTSGRGADTYAALFGRR